MMEITVTGVVHLHDEGDWSGASPVDILTWLREVTIDQTLASDIRSDGQWRRLSIGNIDLEPTT